jgi:hypothetical protein
MILGILPKNCHPQAIDLKGKIGLTFGGRYGTTKASKGAGAI